MDETDARARISNQASRDERRDVADVVIDNSGTPEELARRVDDVWEWLLERAAANDADAASG
jgi:dephospho-CoA kinase